MGVPKIDTQPRRHASAMSVQGAVLITLLQTRSDLSGGQSHQDEPQVAEASREIPPEFWVKFGDIQRYQRIPFKIPVNQRVKEVSQSYLTTMNNKSSRLLTSAVTERSAAVEHQYFRAPNGLGLPMSGFLDSLTLQALFNRPKHHRIYSMTTG